MVTTLPGRGWLSVRVCSVFTSSEDWRALSGAPSFRHDVYDCFVTGFQMHLIFVLAPFAFENCIALMVSPFFSFFPFLPYIASVFHKKKSLSTFARYPQLFFGFSRFFSCIFPFLFTFCL